MAKSQLSDVDEYGFQRPENFNYQSHENFISQYMRILTRRQKRWEELKDSERYKKSNKLKRFVRKGVPLSLRKSTWLAVSGAEAAKRHTGLKYGALKRASANESFAETIRIDLPRTFPDNIYFTTEDALQQQLFNVLTTFAHQNAEVGYCQGLNYIAGLLLLATKHEESTFWLLKMLVEEILPPYYIKSMAGLLTDLSVLDELVLKMEPEIHRHINVIGMPWAVTTTKWFICLYAEVLPTETVLRIWDCLFYEGSKIIFRVGLTLIKMHKESILKTRELGELVTVFKEMGQHSDVINCHVFISNIFKISLSNRTLQNLRRKHS